MAPTRLRDRKRAVALFDEWLRARATRTDHLSVSIADWAEYVLEVRRVKSARHAVLQLQHVDAARTARGAMALQSSSVGEQLRARLNLDIDQSNVRYFKNSTDSYDVATVANYVYEHLPALPDSAAPRDVLRRLRIRALVLLRLATAQRSKDATSIVRSSISEAHENMSGQRVLDFLYTPKGRRGAKPAPVPSMVQYHPSDASRCPARAILALKCHVDALDVTHDQLFVAERKPHAPIGPERAAKLVLGVMTSAGIDTERFKAASIRHMANEKWRHAGVSTQDRNRRGNWSSSHVPNRHYSSAVPVGINFAALASMSPTEVRDHRVRGLTNRQEDGDAV